MAKNTLKILRFEHCKIFIVCLAIFQYYALRGYNMYHTDEKIILQTYVRNLGKWRTQQTNSVKTLSK